jgi:hypothetical protein
MNGKRTMILLAGAWLAAATPAAAQSDIALVHQLLLDRQLAVVAANGAAASAELGQRLRSGETVLTGPNTRAAVRFTDDGSLMRLNPNSQLAIRATGSGSGLVKTIELEWGELWVRATRRDGAQLQVRTPGGVAAVKGTEFIVRYNRESGETTVITIEGEVEFSNGAGTVSVMGGNTGGAGSNTSPPSTRGTVPGDFDGVDPLLDDTPPGSGERASIELTVQDADGRTRTVILEVPRRDLRALLGGGR